MTTSCILRTVTLTLLVTLTYCQNEFKATFTIKEEEGSGKYVGNVSYFNFDLPQDQRENLEYSILKKTDNQRDWQHFSIHDKTGQLFTMDLIDRENIDGCQYVAECILTFDVIATYAQVTQYISVKIIVEDVNDNVPSFPKSVYNKKVSEVSTINYSFIVDEVTDDDYGIFGFQSCEISPPSDTFGLRYSEVNFGIANVELFLKKPLDREIKDRYQIRILAKDGGPDPNTGTTTVIIDVTDINDNIPEFNQSLYNVSIKEDTSPGSTILTISAVDKDIGENGRVSYKIPERQPSAGEILNDFGVNSTTGEIYVKQQLIYKADHHYEFVVEAVDNGEQAKISQARVLVYVIDTGNNPPQVSVSLLSPGNTGFVNISEKEQRGKFVAHINVDDSDSGPNGIVECNVSSSLFKVAMVPGGGFTVVVENPLNREAVDRHNLTVTCYDQGIPPLSSSVSFLVFVSDYNDNRPVFEFKNYMANIYENMIEDQQILQVAATDRDIGKNQEIHYEIRNQDRLIINPNSGVITAKPYFDREKEPVIIFEVLAIDGGENPLTGSATVTLTIKDKNDNPPMFLQPNFEFEIEENLNSGTSIGEFVAKDDDIDENGEFTFSIAPVSRASRFPFIVFSDGKIQSNRELDREERSRYDFDVVVIDQGEPALSSVVSVTIIVTDVNDNSPNITFPTKDNKSVPILYPDAPTDFVTQIQAYDLDKGENKTLTYQIISGNELGLFRIEPDTGLIFIADKSIMIDQNLRLPLQVRVSDNGRFPRNSIEELVIDVTYTNATYSALSEGGNKYVVISVVVVVVTILISAGIIGVIFILRCFDKKKANEAKTQSDREAGFTSKPTLFILNPSGESSTDYTTDVQNDMKKKKEVSFSEDHESINNSLIDLQIVNLPEPVKFAPDKPPRKDMHNVPTDQYDKVTTRLENLKYQQYLMEVQAKKHQQIHHTNPEDSRSETSGETNTDSGHGASESDGPSTSPSHDDARVFDYMIPSQYAKPENQVPLKTSHTHTHTISPPPIPSRSYKPYSSFNNNNSYYNKQPFISEPTYNTGREPITDNSRLSWHPQMYSPYQHPVDTSAHMDYSDYSSLPSYFQGSVKSRDDDECSTTTSGSYTLQSIEDLL